MTKNKSSSNDKEERALSPKVWRRILTAPPFQQALILFRKILNVDFAPADLKIKGMKYPEWLHLRRCLRKSMPHLQFCDLICDTTKGLRKCKLEEKKDYARARATRQINIYLCHAGLAEVAMPIMFRGKYCGMMGLFSGGVLLHKPTKIAFKRIAQAVKDTGVDLVRLKKAYFQIKPISREFLEVMLRFFMMFVEQIIQDEVATKRR